VRLGTKNFSYHCDVGFGLFSTDPAVWPTANFRFALKAETRAWRVEHGPQAYEGCKIGLAGAQQNPTHCHIGKCPYFRTLSIKLRIIAGMS
jgi:hypothetical protein